MPDSFSAPTVDELNKRTLWKNPSRPDDASEHGVEMAGSQVRSHIVIRGIPLIVTEDAEAVSTTELNTADQKGGWRPEQNDRVNAIAKGSAIVREVDQDKI
jgi:hypothetical protein